MSLLTDRTLSLVETRHLLEKLALGLADISPGGLRDISRELLHHFPKNSDLQLVHQAIPTVLGPVPWLQRTVDDALVPNLMGPPSAVTNKGQTFSSHVQICQSKEKLNTKNTDTPKTVPPSALGQVIPKDEFTALELMTRTHLTTKEAAYFLNRRPQTLRGWACHEDGPLLPVRVHGHLAWPVSELKRVLESPASSRRASDD
jgi:hypothetical protein